MQKVGAPSRGRIRGGFTLVEMLVVLVLVALTSGILLQALEQTFRLQERFGVELFSSQQGAMTTDWFRHSVEGMLPDYPDGKDKFAGAMRQFSGLTTNALSANYGVPSKFTWKLVFDPDAGATRLTFDTGFRTASILSWPGDKGRFVYLDAKGEVHETWPPPMGQWPQLPHGVRLEGMRRGESMALVAVPMGPTLPLTRAQDVLRLFQ